MLLQIADEFQLRTRDLVLSLRGFALAPESPVTLLRDGDIIVVTADNTLEVCGIFCGTWWTRDDRSYSTASRRYLHDLCLQLTGTVLDIQQAAVTAPGHVVEAPLLLGSNLSPEKQHSQHAASLALPSAQIRLPLLSKKERIKLAEARERQKQREAAKDLDRDTQEKGVTSSADWLQ